MRSARRRIARRICCIALAAGFLFCWYSYAKIKYDSESAYLEGYQRGMQYEQMRGLEAFRSLQWDMEYTLGKYPKCSDPKRLAELITKYSYAYGVPCNILLGIICQESSCDPSASSKAGALGLTQIRWKFWGDFLVERGIAQTPEQLLNPETAIHAGVAILEHLLAKYDGDIEKALAHYSGGAVDYCDKIFDRAMRGD